MATHNADEAFEEAVQAWLDLRQQGSGPDTDMSVLQQKSHEYATWAGISDKAAAEQIKTEAQRRLNEG